MTYSNTIQQTGDWMVIKSDEILVDLNEIKKKHPSIFIQSYKWCRKVMNYILVIMYLHIIKNSTAFLSDRLNTIFHYTGKRVNVNALRSSYVSLYLIEIVKQ